MRYDTHHLIYSGFFGILLLTLLVSSYATFKLKEVSYTLEVISEANRPIVRNLRKLRDLHIERIVQFEKAIHFAEQYRMSKGVYAYSGIEYSVDRFKLLGAQIDEVLKNLKQQRIKLKSKRLPSDQELDLVMIFEDQFTPIGIDYKVNHGDLRLLDIEKFNRSFHKVSIKLFSLMKEKSWSDQDQNAKQLMEWKKQDEKQLEEYLKYALKTMEDQVELGAEYTREAAEVGQERIALFTMLSVLVSVLLAVIFSGITRRMGASIKAYINIKDSLSDLANTLRKGENLQSMVNGALSFMASQVPVVSMGFYHLASRSEQGGGSLCLVSSYAAHPDTEQVSSVMLGEGLIGQCALDKRLIRISAQSKRSEKGATHLKIDTGIGQMDAAEILCLPVMYEDELLGVLEIVSIKRLTNSEVERLQEMLHLIGISVHAAINNDQLKALLKQSQRNEELIKQTNEEMHLQQEELRQANAALREQTIKLRQSEESLMQQHVELQSTNRELKVKQLSIKRQAAVLSAAKRSLETKTKELEVASQYKSAFLANMSHELRTPLNSLLILSRDLADNREGNLTQQQQEDAEYIYEGGTELLMLINDILDLSKVEAGKLSVIVESVDVRETVEKLYIMFKRQSEKRSLVFEYHVEEGVCDVITSDGQRLEQILKNFLSNAIKFTHDGGVNIWVGYADKQTLAFRVEDSGIGIPESKQQEIFEAFQQQDSSISRRYGGTGLGLTIARELAQLLGGEVTMCSKEGEGSTFSLLLPLDWNGEPARSINRIDAAGITTDVATEQSQRIDVQGAAPSPLAIQNHEGNDNANNRVSLHNVMESSDVSELLSESELEQLLLDEREVSAELREQIEEITENIKPVGEKDKEKDKEKEQAGIRDGVIENIEKDEMMEKIGKVGKEDGLGEGAGKVKRDHVDNDKSSAIVEIDTMELQPVLPRSPTRRREEILVGAIEVVYEEGDQQRLQGKRILLVDDDVRTVYALSGCLKRAGCDVEMAENGSVALEKMESQLSSAPDLLFDLLIIEASMPEMGGVETLERVRLMEAYRSLPCILLEAQESLGTAKDEALEKVTERVNDSVIESESVQTEFIQKPIHLELLFGILRKIFHAL